MNTIEDLRATLREHANEPPHAMSVARATAVHQRVAVARRRRRAVVGGAVAAVVAVVGGVSLLPRPDRPYPADRRLAGHVAPETIDSLGYTFAFEEGFEGDGVRRVQVDASDGPLVVTWAASSDDLRLRSDLGIADEEASPRGVPGVADFSDWALVDVGQQGWLEARSATGDVAIAVYTLERRPEGLTKDGMTWRQQTAQGSLVGGAIGDEGQSAASFEVTMPAGRLSFDSFCSVASSGGGGAAEQPWLLWYVDGKPAVGGQSCSGPQRDFDLSSGLFSTRGLTIAGHRYVAGDVVTIEARLQVTDSDPRLVDDPQARIAIALYSPDPDAAVVRELAGHRWVARSTDTGTGGREVFLAPETTAPISPILRTRGPGTVDWDVLYDGRVVGGLGLSPGAGGSLPVLQPWQSRRIVLRATSTDRPVDELRTELTYYVRAD